MPHFYLTVDCNLDALLKLRGELNAGLEARGVKLSVNDLLVKALGVALTEVPDANVRFDGDALTTFSRVDISMAVAIPGGLITPVIVDAAGKSLSRIATESKDLAARARDGKLKPEHNARGIRHIRYAVPALLYTYFKLDDPVVGGNAQEKIALRRAIGLGFNTPEFVRVVQGGDGIPATQLLPPGVDGYDPAGAKGTPGRGQRARSASPACAAAPWPANIA